MERIVPVVTEVAIRRTYLGEPVVHNMATLVESAGNPFLEGLVGDPWANSMAMLRGLVNRPLEVMRRSILASDPGSHVTVRADYGNHTFSLSQEATHTYASAESWQARSIHCICDHGNHTQNGVLTAAVGGWYIGSHVEVSKLCGQDSFFLLRYCDDGGVAERRGGECTGEDIGNHAPYLSETQVFEALDRWYPAPPRWQCFYCCRWVEELTENGSVSLVGVQGAPHSSWVCEENPNREDPTHLVRWPKAHEVSKEQAVALLSAQRFMDLESDHATCEKYPDNRRHDHYQPCPSCGDRHRSTLAIADRVMGGGLVLGDDIQLCSNCGMHLRFMPRSLGSI